MLKALRRIARRSAKSTGLYRFVRPLSQRVLNPTALARERNDRAFYRQFIGAGDIVFDVGANFGEKARIFLAIGAKVIAVEPQLRCLAEIKVRCGTPRNLVLVEAGMGEAEGRSPFFVRQCAAGSGLIETWEGQIVSTTEVQVVTADALIAKHGLPVFVKIDVEGYELKVLQGLTVPVPTVSFEYHLTPPDIDKSLRCVERLQRLGRIQVNVTSAEELRFRYSNWLEPDQFFDIFPGDLQSDHDYRYGDIFVRSNERTS